MPNVGLPEVAVLVLILILIFGISRIPDLGRAIGEGARELRDGLRGERESGSQPDQSAAAGADPREEEAEISETGPGRPIS